MTAAMDQFYYETVDRLEKMQINQEYIQGWIGGFLGNPEREEQRMTEAYSAGYADGRNKETTNSVNWKTSA